MEKNFNIDSLFKTLYQIFWVSSVISFLFLISSTYSIQVLDRVLSSGSYHTLFWITFMAIAVYAEMHFLQAKRVKILTRLSCNVDLHFLAMDLHTSLLYRSNKISSNIANIQAFLISPYGIIGLCDALWGVGFLIAIFCIHWVNGLIAMLGTIAIGIIAYVMENALLKPKGEIFTGKANYANKWMSGASKDSGLIATCFKNILAFISTNRLSLSYVKIDHKDIEAKYQNITAGMKAVLQTLLYASSACLIIENQMTSGEMIATSILFGKMSQPFTAIGSIIKTMKNFSGSYKEMRHLMFMQNDENLIPEMTNGTVLSIEKLHISAIKGVYQEENRYALRDINLKIPSGASIAVIGNSSGGKTVLLQAICGVIKPVFGKVKLGELDVEKYIGAGGVFVSYLSIDADFLVGNVLQNITRFDSNPDKLQLEEVVRTAKLEGFILSLVNGYETTIDNLPISFAYKRLILIARAFYKWPKVILLNNPSMGLDEVGLNSLQRLIFIAKGKGCIVITETQNNALIKASDRCIVLNNGELQKYTEPANLFNKPLEVEQR